MQKTKSTAQILNEILQSYSLKNHSKQKGKLHEKYQIILMLLQKEFSEGLADTPFQSGSLAKGTAINVKFDLDMVVPFRRDVFSSPEDMFKQVEKVLRKGELKPRLQKVSLGIKALKVNENKTMYVDVVPGLEIQKNSYKNTKDLLLFNRIEKSVIKTNLERQFKHIKSQDNQILAVIRFMKMWNHKETNINLKSYMLELLTINANKNKRYDKLKDKLLWNFEYISNHLDLPLKDPGNASNTNLLSEIKPSTIKDIKNRMAKIHKKLKVGFDTSDEKIIKSFFC